MTISTQLVLRALLAEPGTDVYGAQIGEAAGLMSGTVHPILARLEGIGWVESHWEDVDPQAVGRPVRRFYRITPPGAPFTLAWRWNTCRSHSGPASVARGDRGDLTMRPAPQPMQPGGVHPTGLLPRLVVWGTTLVLPTAEVRHRYHREHVAELSVLAPRGPQRWYALGALATAWTLAGSCLPAATEHEERTS